MTLTDRLKTVYGGGGNDGLSAAYDDWASTYDEDLQRAEYRFPSICAGLVARHAPPGNEPLLDIGAGTGAVGSILHPLGYTRMIATDISEAMLDRAKARDVYADVQVADVTKGLPFPDGSMATVTAVGILTLGHLTGDVLPDFVRVVRSGGMLVFSISNYAFENNGFGDALAVLESAGQIRKREITPSFSIYPSAPDLAEHLGRCFAYQKV